MNIDNKLFLISGKKNNLFFCYDGGSNEIERLGDLRFSHFYGSLVYLDLSNCIYCIGGINTKKCEIYRNDNVLFTNNNLINSTKIQQNTWEALPDLNYSRQEFCSLVVNNFIYVFFGFNNLTNGNNNSIERINVNFNDFWEVIMYTVSDSINVCLSSHACALVNQEEVYIFGGYDGKTYKDGVLIFNTTNNSIIDTNYKIPDFKKNTMYQFYKEANFVKIVNSNTFDEKDPDYILFDSKEKIHLLNSKTYNYSIINSTFD